MSQYNTDKPREIRIGNDIVVKWEILTNGKPTSLDGRDLSLTLWHAHNSWDITDFSVTDNQLMWTFAGKDQRHTGDYILTLCENKGQAGMATLDTMAFRLVPRMFGTNGLTEPAELILETANISASGDTYDLATETRNGLMSKEDKKLLNQYRAALDELTDDTIRGWFYDDGEEDDSSLEP